jgi:hypothetical protein
MEDKYKILATIVKMNFYDTSSGISWQSRSFGIVLFPRSIAQGHTLVLLALWASQKHFKAFHPQ